LSGPLAKALAHNVKWCTADEDELLSFISTDAIAGGSSPRILSANSAIVERRAASGLCRQARQNVAQLCGSSERKIARTHGEDLRTWRTAIPA
jgi:hypothetical protein